ncbi:hypothetical protein [Krasilnikovia sp. MM14-A1004]|uniref:hypothetical protein n=1 Tax=Krasilnikovia sp. MM14-A1004 TaxID=3373541 RepID=UPI00399CD8D9
MTAPPAELLARADTELRRLEAAATAVAANLVDLDDNTARKELDGTRLTGTTAAAWADATTALTQLWDGYGLLTALTTSARAARDARRFGDAEKAAYVEQVLGRSITLSTATVPLAQRGLLGAGQVSTTCTPAELLAAMEAAFATVVDVATRAGDVWQRLLPRAAELAAALDQVRALTGPTASTTLDEADRRLGEVTAVLATDPLGCDENGLAAVRALIDRADAERTSAVELREALTRRLADAHTLAGELSGAARAAQAAAEAVSGRFADADIATIGGADADPGADLAAIDALAAAGHWSLLSGRLADWTRHARQRLAALRDAAERNSGLLGTRNELRGRFEAYQAKAARRGIAEDATLTPLVDAARAALWTAPCDLDAARTAVTAYQNALTALTATHTRDGQL